MIRNFWKKILLMKARGSSAKVWKRGGFTPVLHAFFNKKLLFSAQPQCCFTFSWIEPQLLLRCCSIHTSIIILRLLIFTIFVSIYIVSMRSIFHFHLHFHYEYNTRILRIKNAKFSGIAFMWTQTYSEIFKSALVYL